MSMRITLLAISLSLGMHADAFADMHRRIVDEPLSLTIHMHWPSAQGYEETYPVEQAARAMTGIELVDRTAGADSKGHGDAVRQLLALDELPDIVGGNRIRDLVNQYGPEGLFLPLDDLILAHAPHIASFLDARPEIRRAIAAWDQKIYYIPYVPDGKFGRAYFIRQDWLDKLGLKSPQNVDELYRVLQAFRDGDPNGNGHADEIPIFQRQWEELIRYVTLWDGRSTGSDSYHDFMVQDGQITHPYVEPGYREGIRNLAKWYDEGLIDPEIFSRGSQARDELLGTDRGGMTHDWFASTAGYNAALAEAIVGFDLAPMLPPASVSGRRLEEHRRTPVKPDGWAITSANEQPIETMRYFDFWFTPEGCRLANFGVEGRHYDLVDGAPVFKDALLADDRPLNRLLIADGAQIPRGFPQDYDYEIQWTSPAALAGIELYERHDLLVEPFLGVALNQEEQEDYDFLWRPIRAHMLDMQKSWILGERDIEADWQVYLATLDDMGLQQVIGAMNSAYARQSR